MSDDNTTGRDPFGSDRQTCPAEDSIIDWTVTPTSTGGGLYNAAVRRLADAAGYEVDEVRHLFRPTPQQRLEERVREFEARIANLERRPAACDDESDEQKKG